MQLFWVSEFVGSYCPPLGVFNGESFKGNPEFPDIPRCSWGVGVTILALQFFRRNGAMLENVINHRLRSLGRNRFQRLCEVRR